MKQDEKKQLSDELRKSRSSVSRRATIVSPKNAEKKYRISHSSHHSHGIHERVEDQKEKARMLQEPKSGRKDEKSQRESNFQLGQKILNSVGEVEQNSPSPIIAGNAALFTQKSAAKNPNELPDNPVVNLARQCRGLGIKLIHGNLRIYNKGAMVPLDYDVFRRMLDEWLVNGQVYSPQYPTANVIKECYLHLLAVAKDDTEEYNSRYEEGKNLIVFSNGTFDATTGILRAHSTKDYVPFRVNAKYMHGKLETPTFDKFVKMQDTSNEYHELRELFLEAIGYFLIANAAAKKFVYCAPRPDSGKSVLGALMSNIFFPENVSTEPINSLGDKFSQGDIWKKNICISMDLSDEILSPRAVGRIKNLTGDACVNTEEKYMPKRTSFHYCKYFFASNSPLRLRRYDKAFYDRVLILPFLRSVDRDKMDMDLQSKLLREKDAIVSLAARSLKGLVNRNFVFQKLKITEKMRAEWSGNFCDPLVQFVRLNCVLVEEEYTFFEDIYASYCRYCDEFFISAMGEREFGKRLLQLYQGQIFSQKKRRGGGNAKAGYVGIALKKDEMIVPVRRDN